MKHLFIISILFFFLSCNPIKKADRLAEKNKTTIVYPEFNFNASINGANLHNLKLIKDSVQFDAEVKTNFKGSNLENIEGMVELTKMHLTKNP